MSDLSGGLGRVVDFDEVQRGPSEQYLKWNVEPEALPMWVADMDFKASEEVQQAVQAVAQSGFYCYAEPDAAPMAGAVRRWWGRRHGLDIRPEWVLFVDGVNAGIGSVLRTLTAAGDSVALLTPVYHHFFHTIRSSGRAVAASQMLYQDGQYGIDWPDLEAKLGSARVTAMIMCNPHNPTGQLWDAATLDRVHQLARANDVLVISDEVHCDLTDPGQQYTPYLVAAGAGPGAKNAAVVEGAVMAASPSKAFNLAGLKCAALVVPEPGLRRQIARGLTRDELSMPNVFAFAAAVAAYDQSEYWLDQLRDYVATNRQVATAEINRLIPEATVVESVATYLMWIDLRVWVGRSEAFAAAARRLTGIIVDPGAPFGPGGEGFVRLNLAAPRALVLDGINRLAQALEQGADSSW